MKRSAQEGSLLILSLWILMIFSALIIGLSFQSGADAKIAKLSKDYFINNKKALAALNYGIYLIESDSNPSVDSKLDVWYNPPSGEGVNLPSELSGIRLYITDEESRINLNFCSQKMLENTFELLDDEYGLETNDQDLVEDLIEHRGIGSGASFQTKGENSKTVMNYLAEVTLMKSFSSADYPYILKHFTVHPRYGNFLQINPNTSDILVIESIIGGLAADQNTKDLLAASLIDFLEDEKEEGEGEIFRARQFSAYRFLDQLGLAREVKLISLSVQLLRHFNVNSRFFRVVMVDETGKQVQATVGPRKPSEEEIKILNWKESFLKNEVF